MITEQYVIIALDTCNITFDKKNRLIIKNNQVFVRPNICFVWLIIVFLKCFFIFWGRTHSFIFLCYAINRQFNSITKVILQPPPINVPKLFNTRVWYCVENDTLMFAFWYKIEKIMILLILIVYLLHLTYIYQ